MHDTKARPALGRPLKYAAETDTIDGKIREVLRLSNKFTAFCDMLGLSHNSVSGTWFRHAKLERRLVKDDSVFAPHRVVAALRGVATSLEASARSYVELAERIKGTWGGRLNYDGHLDSDVLDTLLAHNDLSYVASLVGYKVASSLRYYLLRRSLVSPERAPSKGCPTHVTPATLKAALTRTSERYAQLAAQMRDVATQLEKHSAEAP